MTQFWLWIGVISMAIGCVFFGIGAHRAKTDRWKNLFILNFFICLIAGGLYLAMALGLGLREIQGRPTFWVRYLTWFFSTPLLLLDLALLGRTSLPTISSLIGANAFMIATGFVATINPKPMSYIWYIVSCFAFLATLYLLFFPYRVQAEQKHPRSKRLFHRLLTVHGVLWTIYPIVWMFASTGFNVLSQGSETMAYTMLDIASKVGFGFLSLNTLYQLEKSEAIVPQSERTPQKAAY